MDVRPNTAWSERFSLRSQFDGSTGAAARPEAAVLVVRVAHERGVVVGRLPVDARAEQMPAVRVREHAAKRAGRRQVRLERDDAFLVRVLVVAEEEEAILANRTADPDAGIAPREERIRVERIAPQAPG